MTGAGRAVGPRPPVKAGRSAAIAALAAGRLAYATWYLG